MLMFREISVDEALDIRASQSLELCKQITQMVCVECGKPARPHKHGGKTAAHFEHSERNAGCRLSDTKRIKGH